MAIEKQIKGKDNASYTHYKVRSDYGVNTDFDFFSIPAKAIFQIQFPVDADEEDALC